MRRCRSGLFIGGVLALVLAGPSCSSNSPTGGPDAGPSLDGGPADGDSGSAEDSGCWVTEALASTDDVCVFALPAPPNSNTSNDHIYVWADSLRINQDQTDADGWDYADASHGTIEIYGPNCDRIQAGVVQAVTVTYFCYGPA